MREGRRLPRPYRSRAANALVVALAVLAVATAAGLIALWPRGDAIPAPPGVGSLRTESARVTVVNAEGCRSAVAGDPAATPGVQGCRRVTVRLTSGPDEGDAAGFDIGGPVDIDVGDRVRVAATGVPADATVGGVTADRYAFSDFERRSTLLWLTIAFAVIVIATSRWRGARALAGLAVSLGVVLLFVVPAILEGASPLGVATVGALAIMLVTIPLAHGTGPKAVAAALGTACALLLTVVLARLATSLAHITGFSSEEATFLSATTTDLSIQGLLLAGIVIGALGVLDDLTVSQASVVMALRRADPSAGGRHLFREALSVGHDHIAATVNTLVLAYVGASLPVLLVFSVAGTSTSDAVNSEVVASEIVATLVGSIGLIAAVPITTGIAALLATRVETERLGDAAHGHTH
ncbi:YibE/F family protein [Miltoncostaea oceani]|uniref:YibE/F family protein n=1 Tax=Miltoncostaea oceani TaxID=2843216 RepID=UPI001C3C6934|nr:YibE/F family protein [Miltoncostaea oceani]